MGNFDPKRMLALKLTTLSSSDRKWLLRRLPGDMQPMFEQQLASTKKFAGLPLSMLTQRLQTTEDPGHAGTVQTQTQQGFSPQMQTHLQGIASGDINVTDSVKAFVVAHQQGSTGDHLS